MPLPIKFNQNYQRRVRLIWLIILLLLLITPSQNIQAEPAVNPIVISEIAAYEKSNHEWVEIYNRGAEPVDLTGWKFYEAETQHKLSLFQGSFIIEPDTYIIIADDAENLILDYPEFTGTILDSSWTSLKESGEEIGLVNAEGEFVELFTYLSCPDTSLERIDLSLDDYSNINWQVHPDNHSLGEINSVAVENPTDPENPADDPENPPDDPTPPEDPPSPPEEPEDLEPPAPIQNLEFSVDDDQFIFYWENPADLDFYQTLILKNLSSTPATPEVGLEYEIGDQINEHFAVFLDQQNIFIDTVIEPHETYYYLFYTLDESFNYSESVPISLALDLPIVKTGQLQLNEIYPYPKPKGDEWIELYNASTETLDLTGVSLADESGHPYYLSGSLTPQNYLLVKDFSFSLNNSGDTIILKNSIDTIIDEFSYGTTDYPAPTKDQSYGRSSNEWQLFHHPTTGEPNQIINSTPQAIILIQSGNLKDYPPLSLNLDGSSSHDPDGDELTFAWDYDDDYLSDKENPASHKFEAVGIYEITLTVTDPLGAQDSTSLTVEILDENAGEEEESTLDDEDNENEPEDESENNSADDSETDTSTSAENSSPLITDSAESENDSSKSETTPATYPHTIQITEILPNPAGRDSENEWIEIYNFGETPTNLENYQLDDGENGSRPYSLPEIIIPPQSYLVFYSSQTQISLNNKDEQARLFDPLENLIHQIKYEESAAEAESYALTADNQFSWTTHLTPGQPNQIVSDSENPEKSETTSAQSSSTKSSKSSKKTPLYQNGDLSDEIIISEILPNPEGSDTETEWIEIQNLSDQTINLGNWSLDDSEKGSVPYVFSDQTTIPAQSYLLIPRLQSKISLNNSNDQVRLFDFENTLIDEIEYNKAPEELSYARVQIIDRTQKSLVASLTPLPAQPAVEEKWEWTDEITAGEANPTYQILQGKIETVDQTSFTFTNESLSPNDQPARIAWNPEINPDLSEIVFTPGLQIKLLVHEKDPQSYELKNFEILEQPPPPPEETPNPGWPIKTILLISFLTLLGIYFISRKYPALLKTLPLPNSKKSSDDCAPE